MRAVLQIEVAAQPRTLAETLADLAADAVGRTHHAAPRRRSREIQPPFDPPDPVVAVKRLSEAVGDIFLRRKAFRWIFRPAFGQYPVSDAALRPGLRQCIEPLAAQLRGQRRRDEPVAALPIVRMHSTTD